MAKSVCKSASAKVPVRDRASHNPGRNRSESCRVVKKALQRGEEGASLVHIDQGQSNCTELGTTVKNPPAYRERYGLKDNAVNWGDGSLTEVKYIAKHYD